MIVGKSGRCSYGECFACEGVVPFSLKRKAYCCRRIFGVQVQSAALREGGMPAWSPGSSDVSEAVRFMRNCLSDLCG